MEFALFIEVCKRRALDPFAKQVFAIKRGPNMVIQTSIDGYRLIAERSGRYLGQSEPLWCGEDSKWVDVWTKKTPPFAAKVGVFKQGHGTPTWGIAYWETYAAPGPFWKKAPAHMLAKCAEALALKKAFPEELSGLYTDDEMAQADNTMVTTTVPPVVASDEPVMIFPKEVTKSWADNEGVQRAFIVDTSGQTWLFTGEYFQFVDKAIGENGFLIVNYKVDNNTRVVTGVVPQ